MSNERPIRCKIVSLDRLGGEEYIGHLIDVVGPVVGIKPSPPWRSIRGVMASGPASGQRVEFGKAIVQVTDQPSTKAEPPSEPPTDPQFGSLFDTDAAKSPSGPANLFDKEDSSK